MIAKQGAVFRATSTYLGRRKQRYITMPQDQRARNHAKRRATKRIAAKKAANEGTPTAASKRTKKAKA